MIYERRIRMKSKVARWILLITALIIGCVLLVACQPADQIVDQPAQPPTETVTEQLESGVDEPAPTETETEVSAAQQDATEDVAVDQQESQDEEQLIPTARIGLVATNPEDVNLASGDIQLVEFFAFW
jgi:cytoskeletal protein RodZ